MTQKNRKILVTTYTSAANFANETIMGCDWYVDANHMLTIDAWRGGLRITVAQYMPGQWRSVRFTGSLVKPPVTGLTLTLAPDSFSIEGIGIWDASKPEGGDTHEEQDTSDSTGGDSPDSGAGGLQGHDGEHEHSGSGDYGFLR